MYFWLIRWISKNWYIVDTHDIFDEELPEYNLQKMSVSFFVKNKKITFNVILEDERQDIENKNVMSIWNVKYRLRNNMSYSSVYNFLFNNN